MSGETRYLPIAILLFILFTTECVKTLCQVVAFLKEDDLKTGSHVFGLDHHEASQGRAGQVLNGPRLADASLRSKAQDRSNGA